MKEASLIVNVNHMRSQFEIHVAGHAKFVSRTTIVWYIARRAKVGPSTAFGGMGVAWTERSHLSGQLQARSMTLVKWSVVRWSASDNGWVWCIHAGGDDKMMNIMNHGGLKLVRWKPVSQLYLAAQPIFQAESRAAGCVRCVGRHDRGREGAR